MRRLFTPSTIVSIAIIAAVAAMVAVANWRDVRRSRAVFSRPLASGTRGAGTKREDLSARIVDVRARVAARPDDIGLAVTLADALVRQTRITGNTGLAIEAEAALTRALVADPGNYDANRELGSLLLSQHRFREAVSAGEKNRDARPYDAINYGIIGDGHLELGEYDQAFAAFDKMMSLRPSAASYARVAYARELQGNLTGAVESMTLAADATAPEDAEALAWHHAQVGDLYLRLGKLHEAEAAYVASSHAFPGHPFAMMGYARLLAARGERSSALALLQELAKTAPTPDLAARTGDLLESLGRHDEAERQYALAESGWRVDAPEPKNLARFLAEHNRRIPEAVAIAEKAASERRDIFTEDALAWAYFKAGRLSAAREAIAQALRTGSKDADIHAHAKAIEAATGQAAAR
ncbi:MAG TPA: tetratricopeptide repeat protein [Vicinamibacterales bacterium]|nr:tetratricopeptide repeat protein [Vicinamibacterales bacterium]